MIEMLKTAQILSGMILLGILLILVGLNSIVSDSSRVSDPINQSLEIQGNSFIRIKQGFLARKFFLKRIEREADVESLRIATKNLSRK